MCSGTTTVCTSPRTERYLSQRGCVIGGRRLEASPRPSRGESSLWMGVSNIFVAPSLHVHDRMLCTIFAFRLLRLSVNSPSLHLPSVLQLLYS